MRRKPFSTGQRARKRLDIRDTPTSGGIWAAGKTLLRVVLSGEIQVELKTLLGHGEPWDDERVEQLMRELLRLHGPDAVRCALATQQAARSLDRIADHAVVLGARLRYLLTGNPAHLAAEIR